MDLDTFDPVWDRLLFHLRAAGRTLTRPVTDVRVGEPAVIPGPMIACWWEGEDEGDLIRHTLTGASYTDRVIVRWYWPVSDRALSEVTERQLRRAVRATQRALLADSLLGGACAALRFPERTTAGWLDLGPGWARVVTLTLAVEMADEDIIGTGG
ncbi:MAG TPA: hypothetical protein VLM76_11680 [Patescibacteria group bacterium]|nr:hypothetical protein [Patescibacteria group bacterium]